MRVVGNRRDGRGFTCRKVNGLSDNQLSLEQRTCSRNGRCRGIRHPRAGRRLVLARCIQRIAADRPNNFELIGIR